MTEERRRGRPAGTEINDNEALAKIADLLLASPDMKVADAIRTVYTAGKHKGQSLRATEERWRTKLKDRRPILMEAATKRKAAKEVGSTSGGSVYPMGAVHGVSIATVIGAHRTTIGDAVIGATGAYRTIADAVTGATRAADEFRMAFGQVGYGPNGQVGATYEVIRRIEEEQHLVNQITEQQRLMNQIDEQRRLLNQISGRNRLMNQIDEQQRLMDQVNNANRYSFWPYR